MISFPYFNGFHALSFLFSYLSVKAIYNTFKNNTYENSAEVEGEFKVYYY